MGKAKSNLKKNMLWNSFGSLTYLGLSWLTTILVVRLSHGFDAAGQLSLAMTISNIFTPFAMFKVRAFQVSDIKREYEPGEYIGFRIITDALALAALVIYTLVTCDFSVFPPVIMYALFKCVDVFIDVLHGIDQLHDRLDYAGKSLFLRGTLSFLGFCAGLILSNDLTIALFLMFLLTVPVLLFFDIPIAKRFEHLRPKFTLRIKDLAFACLPAVLALFFTTCVTSFPRQVLVSGFGDSMLGIYASVAAPILVIQMGASYIYSPLLGTFAEHYQSGNTKKFARLIGIVTVSIIALGAICAIAISLFGEAALTLIYGSEISPYTYLMYPLLVFTLLTAYVWFLSDLLICVRSQQGVLVGSIFAFVATIASMNSLVSTFDMNGVSYTGIIAYALCLIIFCGFLVWSIKRSRQLSLHNTGA